MDQAVEETVYPSREINRCPYAPLAELRRSAPVHKVPGRNEYVVSRYDDVKFILRHPEIFSSVAFVMEDGIMRTATLDDVHDRRIAGIQATDDPVHAVKRKLAFQFFKPALLPSYEQMVGAEVEHLLGALAGADEIDFVDRFAVQLPARVMFNILGLPMADVARAELWARYDGQGTRYQDAAGTERIQVALRDMSEYLVDVLIERHTNPGDDVLSEWIRAHVAADGDFDLPNLVADASNLLVGGIATTGHMLASTVRLLLTHPATLARTKADDGLIVRAIEESLRLESPIQWNSRLVLEDVELCDVTVPAGALVIPAYCSANRDEARFSEPEVFDIDRSELKNHIGFGHGTHFCMGAPLARMEGRIALQRFFARFPAARLAERNDYAVLDSIALRGLESLWLVLGPDG